MVLYLLQNEANQLHSRDNFDVLAIRVLTNDTDSLYDVWNNTRKNNDHHLFRKNTSLVTLSHSWQFVRMKVFIWPELRVIWFSIRSIIRFNISYQWQAPYIQTFEKESHWNKILWERNEIEIKNIEQLCSGIIIILLKNASLGGGRDSFSMCTCSLTILAISLKAESLIERISVTNREQLK